MGDGWETARKPDRPAVLELGPDGLVKVRVRVHVLSVRYNIEHQQCCVHCVLKSVDFCTNKKRGEKRVTVPKSKILGMSKIGGGGGNKSTSKSGKKSERVRHLR